MSHHKHDNDEGHEEERDEGNVRKPDEERQAEHDPKSDKIAQKAQSGPMGDEPIPAAEMRSNHRRRKG